MQPDSDWFTVLGWCLIKNELALNTDRSVTINEQTSNYNGTIYGKKPWALLCRHTVCNMMIQVLYMWNEGSYSRWMKNCDEMTMIMLYCGLWTLKLLLQWQKWNRIRWSIKHVNDHVLILYLSDSFSICLHRVRSVSFFAGEEWLETISPGFLSALSSWV